jgi:hypothetical protein
VPPVALRPELNDTFAVPPDRLVVVIARAAGATTIERLADFVCVGFPASVIVAVKLNVPVAVGVPEIRPVLGARLSPVGRLPDEIDQV